MMYQRQSEGAFDDSPVAVLYQRYAQFILHYIHRYVASREDADDLVLEVFIAMLDNQVWIEWSDEKQLAWLRGIAHNKAVDHLRHTARRPSIVLDDALDILYEDENRAPEQVALRHEDSVQLRMHLAKLSTLQQEILQLRFAYDMRTKEIAQVLNRSDDVIRVLLSRSLNLLRRLYNRQEGTW
jgi:RNA polymerase sigma-70 factor (ECF subfamily)